MDPVTHTLAGAALAKAGLERRTPLAMATLLIGANLPDVDVAAYWWGETFALTFRRGWTHGVLALVLLPVVLTGLMLAWDRWVRLSRDRGRPPASLRELLLLSVLAVASHPLLDLLNVYGIRLLMPFSDRWFYGDVLFIVDPWLWLVLAAGTLIARHREAPRPARVALVVFGLYVGAMAVSGLASRRMVARAMPDGGRTIERMMSAPVPVTPFRRWIVVDEGGVYRVGEFDWLQRPAVRFDEMVVLPVRRDAPEAGAALRTAAARDFLYWARFPFFRTRKEAEATMVEIIDARYAVDADAPFGAVTVPVAR